MKQILTTILFTAAFLISGKAQKVINTTGGFITTTTGSLEYAIGEISIATVYDNFTTPIKALTQGLLQPIFKTNSPDCAIINDTIRYFPNPVESIVAIVPSKDWITGYSIFSEKGELVGSGTFTNNTINVSKLAAAAYFIKLLPGCDNKYRILKIIKK